MRPKRSLGESLLAKVAIIVIMALLMSIPLSLIRTQVRERQDRHEESLHDITRNWGHCQTISGPEILLKIKQKNAKEEEIIETRKIAPESLAYEINSTSQELHRSIFTVPVYSADVRMTGSFLVDEDLSSIGRGKITFKVSDMKGILGKPTIKLGSKELQLQSEDGELVALASFAGMKAGDAVDMEINIQINGSEALYIRPIGNLTTVKMTSDYPNPSFAGDYLPKEREVRPDGFTAQWTVSQYTLTGLANNYFGVRLIEPVDEYRQTERAAKYGLLIIFLVFLAGFIVEIISKKSINILQYLVVGASLVLFYSLLLAFSEFIPFAFAYLTAAVMTTVALTAYFVGIMKDKWAWVLGVVVALMYGVIYILLHMETFAFLAGTLVLFFLLCVIMALTRNLHIDALEFGPGRNTPLEPGSGDNA